MIGDGAKDLDKPSVAEQARIRIDNSDLTALFYLRFYSSHEFTQ